MAPEEVPVIRQGQGVHLVFHGLLDEIRNGDRAVEQGVVAVDV